MSFTDRLKAAMKGSREMRAILIRDPNKMIAAAVLSSPKLNDAEIEGFSRMANVSEEVLRVIGSNRAWTKNYNVVVGLSKNPKTPVALSLNLMARLNDRDVSVLASDRNVPEPLRQAARRKVAQSNR
jgi:Asp-tRNA(Asn)/Glu-tRNA(Gln) amidotransferase B subunit